MFDSTDWTSVFNSIIGTAGSIINNGQNGGGYVGTPPFNPYTAPNPTPPIPWLPIIGGVILLKILKVF